MRLVFLQNRLVLTFQQIYSRTGVPLFVYAFPTRLDLLNHLRLSIELKDISSALEVHPFIVRIAHEHALFLLERYRYEFVHIGFGQFAEVIGIGTISPQWVVDAIFVAHHHVPPHELGRDHVIFGSIALGGGRVRLVHVRDGPVLGNDDGLVGIPAVFFEADLLLAASIVPNLNLFCAFAPTPNVHLHLIPEYLIDQISWHLRIQQEMTEHHEIPVRELMYLIALYLIEPVPSLLVQILEPGLLKIVVEGQSVENQYVSGVMGVSSVAVCGEFLETFV